MPFTNQLYKKLPGYIVISRTRKVDHQKNTRAYRKRRRTMDVFIVEVSGSTKGGIKTTFYEVVILPPNPKNLFLLNERTPREERIAKTAIAQLRAKLPQLRHLKTEGMCLSRHKWQGQFIENLMEKPRQLELTIIT